MSDQSQSIPPAHPPSERILRHTFSWRFQPEHLEPLEALGVLFLGACQEAQWWGHTGGHGVIRGSLHAAADDLASVADYFEELATSPAHTQVTDQELALCRKAAAWAESLREFVDEIRDTAGREDR